MNPHLRHFYDGNGNLDNYAHDDGSGNGLFLRVMRNHDLNNKRQIQYKDKDNTITNTFTVTWSGVILEPSEDLVSHPTAIPEHAKSPPRIILLMTMTMHQYV